MTDIGTTPSDADFLAEIRAIEDADARAAGAIPDPEYLRREHDLLVGLCHFYAGFNAVADPDDYDPDGRGGLYVAPGAWPVRGCFDLGALGTAVDADAKGAAGGAR